jgi:cell division septation protein DedD
MMDEEFSRRTKGGTKAPREVVDSVAMDSANRLLTRRVLERIKAIATGQTDTAVAKPKRKGKKAAAETEAEAPSAKKKPAKKKTTKKSE